MVVKNRVIREVALAVLSGGEDVLCRVCSCVEEKGELMSNKGP
jgi:hypothetical protein